MMISNSPELVKPVLSDASECTHLYERTAHHVPRGDGGGVSSPAFWAPSSPGSSPAFWACDVGTPDPATVPGTCMLQDVAVSFEEWRNAP
eukprot:1097997-Karenia_brevis.AAC.1